MRASPHRTLVVGVVPGQPDAVVIQAAALAAQLDARLVCATVDRGRYVVEERPDGSIRSAPVDPDVPEADLPDVHLPELSLPEADAAGTTGRAAGADRIDPDLESRLGRLLDPTGVAWETRALAGDPAHALARLADTLDAAMIVVGTHSGGLRGSLRELFTGSVAAHLAHRQHRPVVVIPLAPVGFDAALPWDSES
ncbi:universal stress protein [Agromyces sp. C10]|uniref:universal stress protein n=1 Tax=Agromyces sp. C10 TaxID=2935077 RepID=UPI00200A80D1|nr:universal stress protein [Agromyces sp. C10]MCK8609287.1 universal stress protein [Agromyces sp. C10]